MVTNFNCYFVSTVYKEPSMFVVINFVYKVSCYGFSTNPNMLFAIRYRLTLLSGPWVARCRYGSYGGGNTCYNGVQ